MPASFSSMAMMHACASMKLSSPWYLIVSKSTAGFQDDVSFRAYGQAFLTILWSFASQPVVAMSPHRRIRLIVLLRACLLVASSTSSRASSSPTGREARIRMAFSK